MLIRTLAILSLVSTVAGAQVRTIDPGMTSTQVTERLGKPVRTSTTGESTFLFYANGCEHKCGMDDLVILEKNVVVDAIFRSANRKYTGKSSSPEPISAQRAAQLDPSHHSQ